MVGLMRHYQSVFDRGLLLQLRFNLAQLDPVASDFDLVVITA
jgi:hypothetical protein